jgi:hypothetical protein
MSTTIQEPTLLFFRSRPEGWATSAYVASSLQSLESSFLLIALGRYPHALLVCASAIESCLQSARIGSKEKDGLGVLLAKAKKTSEVVNGFSDDLLVLLRETRNRIVHRGFSPKDDSESASLYIDVALPFLVLCYKEFHTFDLIDGLLLEYAQQIAVATEVHRLAKAARENHSETPEEMDMSYCFRGLSHLIRWNFKENFSAGWEIDALIHAEETGGKFKRTFETTQELKQLFEVPWSFDCPICWDFGSVVAEIDSDMMDEKQIVTKRMACTNCGLAVHRDEPYLSGVLLHKQIADSSAQILREYGII